MLLQLGTHWSGGHNFYSTYNSLFSADGNIWTLSSQNDENPSIQRGFHLLLQFSAIIFYFVFEHKA